MRRGSVPKPLAGGEGAAARTRRRPATPAAPGAPDDRRVRKTTQALIQALVDLSLERGYDAITVQDLLDRADVGRSTFYAHSRGKDDLVLRSFERMLEGLDAGIADARPAGRGRLAAVRELFHHVGGFNRFHRAMAAGGMLDRLDRAGTATLARTIATRLEARSSRAAGGGDGVPNHVRALALAGALFALLRHWIDSGGPYTPEQMDDMFHALAATDRRGPGGIA
jgi:AcrR family transcriptional regulator